MFTKIKNRMLAKLVALLVVFAVGVSCTTEDSQNPDNPTGKSILQFSFKKELNANLKGDVAATISGTNIDVSLPYGTAVTALKPSITFFAKSVSPATETAQDFTNPVKYTVTANDGSTQIYTVTVTVAKSSAKDISSFNLNLDIDSSEIKTVIDNTTNKIDIEVPYGTNVNAIKPTIVHTGISIAPTNEATQDFTEPVIYRVTAADGSTKDYTVTVKILAQEYGGTLKIGNETISLNNLVPKYDTYNLTQNNYNLLLYDSNGNSIINVQINGVNDGKVIDISVAPNDGGWWPYIEINPIGVAYYVAFSGSNPSSSGTLKITRTPNTTEFNIEFDITVNGTKIIGNYKGIFTIGDQS